MTELSPAEQRKIDISLLNKTVKASVSNFKPPEKLTTSEWADKYRYLSRETSAEAGPWRTERTPYLKEPMNAYSDPRVKDIVMVATSQVGKTEMLLNMMGSSIDLDPGPMVYIMPTNGTSQDLSKRRLAPMIRDSKRLKNKVSDAKSRDANNTILKKAFPGGMLTIASSQSPSELASIPARFLYGDELDRWAISAGSEGDPWELAKRRTQTFYNAKRVRVSTPTIKGRSQIESAFNEGTMELWCHKCPHCGEYHNIVFDNVKYEFETIKVKRKTDYVIKDINWLCPTCGCYSTEDEMRKQPAKWIAQNPEGIENGCRSFWLNAFSSPWMSWQEIILSFMRARKDPEKLQVVFNTILGELWEDRGDLEDEDSMLARREEYPEGYDLPTDKILVLTCGVDTQDNRLEYEIVGHGHYGETWGIKKGVILGKPDNPRVWQELEDIINKTYMYDDNRGLRISLTCVDSGGHYTQDVYLQCLKRQSLKMFAIRGRGGDDTPYISPPKQTKIIVNKQYHGQCWVYNLGVNSGKANIMSSIKVQEAGPKYLHFPKNEDRGYNADYFNGLLSERMVLKRYKGVDRWQWEVIPGHERNEALDCRNYAMAAFKIINPDMDIIEQKAKNQNKNNEKPQPRVKRSKRNTGYDDW